MKKEKIQIKKFKRLKLPQSEHQERVNLEIEEHKVEKIREINDETDYLFDKLNSFFKPIINFSFVERIIFIIVTILSMYSSYLYITNAIKYNHIFFSDPKLIHMIGFLMTVVFLLVIAYLLFQLLYSICKISNLGIEYFIGIPRKWKDDYEDTDAYDDW